MDPYATLGIEKNASPEDVKKAYRKKAMEAHPDRGGDDASMALVAKAWDVLGDPEKRKVYDETGNGDAFDLEAEAVGAFTGLINSVLPYGEKMLQAAADKLRSEMTQLEGQESQAKRELRTCERAREKVRKKKTGGVDLVQRVIDDNIRQKRSFLEDVRRRKVLGERLQQMLEDYEADVPPPASVFDTMVRFSTVNVDLTRGA